MIVYRQSVLYLFREEPSVSVEDDLVVVELEQRAPVRHCEESDIEFLCLVVELRLDVHAHRAGAFVQNGEQGTVVEQPGHRHALLLST